MNGSYSSSNLFLHLLQKFIQLLLNPSTLAPLAVGLKLRTDGEKRPTKASLHAPARIVPAVTHADIELTQLFYYYIGSLYHSLPKTSSPGSPPPLLKTHLLDLLQSGLPHTSPAKLLIRASELSGQSVVGLKKGHARAELRVAHLSIWGERRSKKLKKLVPEQKCHRNVLHVRKAELLKQRWRDEELKMIHWRRRVVSFFFFFSISASVLLTALSACLCTLRSSDSWLLTSDWSV